jgi:hypothetical protein
MSEIRITLPDGSERAYPEGATGADVATSIGSRLAKAAVAAATTVAEQSRRQSDNFEALATEGDRCVYTVVTPT